MPPKESCQQSYPASPAIRIGPPSLPVPISLLPSPLDLMRTQSVLYPSKPLSRHFQCSSPGSPGISPASSRSSAAPPPAIRPRPFPVFSHRSLLSAHSFLTRHPGVLSRHPAPPSTPPLRSQTTHPSSPPSSTPSLSPSGRTSLPSPPCPSAHPSTNQNLCAPGIHQPEPTPKSRAQAVSRRPDPQRGSGRRETVPPFTPHQPPTSQAAPPSPSPLRNLRKTPPRPQSRGESSPSPGREAEPAPDSIRGSAVLGRNR